MDNDKRIKELQRFLNGGEENLNRVVGFIKNEKKPESFDPTLLKTFLQSLASSDYDSEREGNFDEDEESDEERDDEEIVWSDDQRTPPRIQHLSHYDSFNALSPSLMINPSVIHARGMPSSESSNRSFSSTSPRYRSAFETFQRSHAQGRYVDSPRLREQYRDSSFNDLVIREAEINRQIILSRRSGVPGRMIFVPTATADHVDSKDSLIDDKICGFCLNLIGFKTFCPYCSSDLGVTFPLVSKIQIGRILSPKVSPKASVTV